MALVEPTGGRQQGDDEMVATLEAHQVAWLDKQLGQGRWEFTGRLVTVRDKVAYVLTTGGRLVRPN